MAKIFYTERDIEDMVRRGERSLEIDDDVVLTDLAYEQARRMGMQLVQSHDSPPAAPVRPYINKQAGGGGKTAAAPPSFAGSPPSGRLAAIQARVKAAVKARLGDQVEDATLERIIRRVAADLGIK